MIKILKKLMDNKNIDGYIIPKMMSFFQNILFQTD